MRGERGNGAPVSRMALAAPHPSPVEPGREGGSAHTKGPEFHAVGRGQRRTCRRHQPLRDLDARFLHEPLGRVQSEGAEASCDRSLLLLSFVWDLN